jgi:Lar family restriction alleviation protein
MNIREYRAQMAARAANEAHLKPCPFCGGRADIIDVEEPSNIGGKVVQCSECEASTRVWFPIKDSVDRILREAWNRRVR